MRRMTERGSFSNPKARIRPPLGGTTGKLSMAQVTIRLLDGADRGHVYDELDPPVTIGREEGNTIQLNDERVSRFHVKIQEDNDKLVLTDLESTNGTKVNGEDIQLRILRYGDLVMIGRSVLLFGSREEIAGRLAELRKNGGSHHGTLQKLETSEDEASLDYELNWANDPDLQATLHMFEPPELPERLSPAQAAQLSELLEYIHIQHGGHGRIEPTVRAPDSSVAGLDRPASTSRLIFAFYWRAGQGIANASSYPEQSVCIRVQSPQGRLLLFARYLSCSAHWPGCRQCGWRNTREWPGFCANLGASQELVKTRTVTASNAQARANVKLTGCWFLGSGCLRLGSTVS